MKSLALLEISNLSPALLAVDRCVKGANVEIVGIEPVGNYAIKPSFSDGHDSGLYSWDILYALCQHRDELWEGYLAELEKEGASRDPALTPPPPPKPAPKCGPKR